MASLDKNDKNQKHKGSSSVQGAKSSSKKLKPQKARRRSSLDAVLEKPLQSWLDSSDKGDEGGEGLPDLQPDEAMEYEQRLARRKGEAKFGRHVREARDPLNKPGNEMGMGPGIQGHPLLADIPLGSQAEIEQINAAENSAAKMELVMKLENKKRAEHNYRSTPRPGDM